MLNRRQKPVLLGLLSLASIIFILHQLDLHRHRQCQQRRQKRVDTNHSTETVKYTKSVKYFSYSLEEAWESSETPWMKDCQIFKKCATRSSNHPTFHVRSKVKFPNTAKK